MLVIYQVVSNYFFFFNFEIYLQLRVRMRVAYGGREEDGGETDKKRDRDIENGT